MQRREFIKGIAVSMTAMSEEDDPLAAGRQLALSVHLS
jgi:hypothetical protein